MKLTKREMQEFDRHLVNYIMRFESGELSETKTLKFFQYLVNTGKAWTLQGRYGRIARDLIDAGLIDGTHSTRYVY